MNNIEENINGILNEIIELSCCTKEEAMNKLICVSKTKPNEDIMEAYRMGMRDFGENYVQELTSKIEALPKDIRWHMIGHLQTNKVKYIVGKVYLIHSVDSVKLAGEINKESVKQGIISNILVEINVAGEDSKFGTSDMDYNYNMVKEISELSNINVLGVMTIAPATEDPGSNRQYFKALYNFANNELKPFIKEKPVLSMGMSSDYKIALSEGASYIRVGSKIFGERDYSKK